VGEQHAFFLAVAAELSMKDSKLSSQNKNFEKQPQKESTSLAQISDDNQTSEPGFDGASTDGTKRDEEAAAH
jgi:hypothetical protein